MHPRLHFGENTVANEWQRLSSAPGSILLSKKGPPAGLVLGDGEGSLDDWGTNKHKNENILHIAQANQRSYFQIQAMQQPSWDHDFGDLDGGVSDKDLPPTFPQQLMTVLENDTISDVITWLPHGKGWVIRDKKRFAAEVLPKYFEKKSKWTSFTRKLNRWSFTRVTRGEEVGAYYHPMFQKGNHHMCMKMTCMGSKAPQSLEPLNPVALGLATPQMVERGFLSESLVSSYDATSAAQHHRHDNQTLQSFLGERGPLHQSAVPDSYRNAVAADVVNSSQPLVNQYAAAPANEGEKNSHDPGTHPSPAITSLPSRPHAASTNILQPQCNQDETSHEQQQQTQLPQIQNQKHDQEPGKQNQCGFLVSSAGSSLRSSLSGEKEVLGAKQQEEQRDKIPTQRPGDSIFHSNLMHQPVQEEYFQQQQSMHSGVGVRQAQQLSSPDSSGDVSESSAVMAHASVVQQEPHWTRAGLTMNPGTQDPKSNLTEENMLLGYGGMILPDDNDQELSPSMFDSSSSDDASGDNIGRQLLAIGHTRSGFHKGAGVFQLRGDTKKQIAEYHFQMGMVLDHNNYASSNRHPAVGELQANYLAAVKMLDQKNQMEMAAILPGDNEGSHHHRHFHQNNNNYHHQGKHNDGTDQQG
jgi:hypothetical protein